MVSYKATPVAMLVVVVVCLGLVAQIAADVYLHNPRGSNDRNCERNANRNNANRLFNSQNNAAGGYACPRAVGGPEVKTGRMYYYAGSELSIEWTAQHGCGQDQVECDIILQYSCNEDIKGGGMRDGTPRDANDDATDTIPETGSSDPRFGQHEDATYYSQCNLRSRNKGLYTADQNLGAGATSTRQNNGATRYGLECSEERDYYPYWHPTPWRDIAVLTSDVNRCPYYQRESQNVKPKGRCEYKEGEEPTTTGSWANNERSCLADGGKWIMDDSMVNGVAPYCGPAEWSRANHLGNVLGSTGTASYNWTIPSNLESNTCVLRIRYNISTTDFQQKDGLEGIPFVDYNYNGKNIPGVVPQDPYIPFTLLDDGKERYFSLAVNTNQHGRTFQDRSYVFSVKPRPSNISSSAKIYNVNVRGKRGNIVQTFPAVEYDFVPSHLHVNKDDYIHFQWTGSDYNPARGPNDAEGGPRDPTNPNGNPGADRSNIVELSLLSDATPFNTSTTKHRTMIVDDDDDPDAETITRLAFIGQTKCLTLQELKAINNQNDRDFHPQNCYKMNAPTPYFDGGLVQMRKPGIMKYMSTRNNNFSNRDQKGTIVVSDTGMSWGWIVFLVLLMIAFVIALVTVVFIIFKKRSISKAQKASDLDSRLFSDM